MAAGLEDFGNFLNNLNVGEFKSEPYYEENTDALLVYLRDCHSSSKRLNDKLTLFLSIEDGTLVGVEVKGITRILELNRAFGVSVIDHDIRLGVFLAFALVEETDDSEISSELKDTLKELGQKRVPISVFPQAV